MPINFDFEHIGFEFGNKAMRVYLNLSTSICEFFLFFSSERCCTLPQVLVRHGRCKKPQPLCLHSVSPKCESPQSQEDLKRKMKRSISKWKIQIVFWNQRLAYIGLWDRFEPCLVCQLCCLQCIGRSLNGVEWRLEWPACLPLSPCRQMEAHCSEITKALTMVRVKTGSLSLQWT